MKKTMMVAFLGLAFVALGDRTANRAWVEKSLKSLSESVEKQSKADRAWVEESLNTLSNKVETMSAADRAWVQESLAELSESIKTNSNTQAFDYDWVEDNFPRVKKGYSGIKKWDDAVVFTNKVVQKGRYADLTIDGDFIETEFYCLSQEGLSFWGEWGLNSGEYALFKGRNLFYLPDREGTLALEEDLNLCVRGIKNDWYPNYICLTNDIAIYPNSGKGDDPWAIYGADFITSTFFSVGDDFIRLGVSGLEIATATGEISTDGTRHFMELPKGRDGVIALIEDVDLKLSRPSLALGSGAEVTGLRAFQLGNGKNPNNDTLQFRDYQIINAEGKMPSERLKPSAVIDLVKGLSATELAELKTLLGVQ